MMADQSSLLSQLSAPEPEAITVTDNEIGLPARVILYNDDWHTFDEVIYQLIKAVNCSFDEATQKTIEVHEKGKAVVFEGSMRECLKVSTVLEEIALHTQIVT